MRIPTDRTGWAIPKGHFFAALVLGLWLITSPFALAFGSPALTRSDVLRLLVIGFSVVTLLRRSVWAPWAASLIGVWLLLAPPVFQAPTAVSSPTTPLSASW